MSFVIDKINPILGKCFHEGGGRAMFAAKGEPNFASTSDLDYLHARTDEMVQVIAGLVRGMRELKGSRNTPGENPSLDYDRGIDDVIFAVEAELGLPHIAGGKKENS